MARELQPGLSCSRPRVKIQFEPPLIPLRAHRTPGARIDACLAVRHRRTVCHLERIVREHNGTHDRSHVEKECGMGEEARAQRDEGVQEWKQATNVRCPVPLGLHSILNSLVVLQTPRIAAHAAARTFHQGLRHVLRRGVGGQNWMQVLNVRLAHKPNAILVVPRGYKAIALGNLETLGVPAAATYLKPCPGAWRHERVRVRLGI